MSTNSRIQILLYTQQPFVGRGFAAVLRGRPGLRLVACSESLTETRDLIRTEQPAIVLLHLVSRISLTDLRELVTSDSQTQCVLWGDGLVGEFAYQAMQTGVRGILPGTISIECLLDSIRNINQGVLCFEREMMDNLLLQKRVPLTQRQAQLVAMVAQGLKNKEIAWQLSTTEGTIKAYLYKLFRKLGVNDRLGMVLYGQKNLCDVEPELKRGRKVEGRFRLTPERSLPRSLPTQTRERAKLRAVS